MMVCLAVHQNCSLNMMIIRNKLTHFEVHVHANQKNSKSIETLYRYRILNEFSFHTMYYETSCVFYIPEPLARGYTTHNEFHNTSYGMKIHLRFFLSHELTRNEQMTR